MRHTACLKPISDDTEHYEMAHFSTKTTPEKIKMPETGGELHVISREPGKLSEETDMRHPWQTLVSYVDELTVGGRKNSKGQYADPGGSFPGFGKPKEVKVPQDCYPRQCYDA